MADRIVGSNSRFALINFAKEIKELDLGFEVVAVESTGLAELSRNELGHTTVSIPVDIIGKGILGAYGRFEFTIDYLDEDTVGMTWQMIKTDSMDGQDDE